MQSRLNDLGPTLLGIAGLCLLAAVFLIFSVPGGTAAPIPVVEELSVLPTQEVPPEMIAAVVVGVQPPAQPLPSGDVAKAWKESDLRSMMKEEIAAAMPQIKQTVKDAIKEAFAAQQPTQRVFAQPAAPSYPYYTTYSACMGAPTYYSAGACVSDSASPCGASSASACAGLTGASACGSSGSAGVGRLGLFGRIRARRAGAGCGG